ncbi:MHFG family PEP-CTERM protein [Paucibacter sp. APW11]|uniref:MHFG family PEP-CTERM protein n=1 Tax=Roseateles aquae TaxID=3077235 RepID=A0ABU3PF60_9BURK|nr:MHFG family PEP-CTERM protein [Paucibacter sp. APW11]MDT9000995.1 MHFG family PEP-CTERM protein [Paucibacter sp. APW11]
MSLIASLALAASSVTLPHCSWDKPGVNPFMGDLVAAVDHYPDIPKAVRVKLQARMQARSYDEIVSIQRDGINGRARYGAEITDMHFGSGSVCRTVSRAKWTVSAVERGLVYCEDGHCILVPTVCRNVSRIKRLTAQPTAVAPAQAAHIASAEQTNDELPLEIEPPAAGVIGGGAPAMPGSFAQTANLPSSDGGGILGGSSGNPAPLGGGSLPPLPTTSGTPPLPIGPLDKNPPPIPSVPEPQTWAMLAAGLLLVVWMAAKRRR